MPKTNKELIANVEKNIENYWTKMLTQTLADARAEKVASEHMALFADGMAHVALARMAERDGAWVLATQLRMIAEKFEEAAVRERDQVRH